MVHQGGLAQFFKSGVQRVGRDATDAGLKCAEGLRNAVAQRPLFDLVDSYGFDKVIAAQRDIDNSWDLLDIMVADSGAPARIDRFTGYLGMFAFILLLLAAVVTAAKVSRNTELKNLFAAICGSLVGLAAVLLSVWFCYDFGFAVLWTMGILSGKTILPDRTVSDPIHLSGTARKSLSATF